jgi:hypothetical protein
MRSAITSSTTLPRLAQATANPANPADIERPRATSPPDLEPDRFFLLYKMDY